MKRLILFSLLLLLAVGLFAVAGDGFSISGQRVYSLKEFTAYTCVTSHLAADSFPNHTYLETPAIPIERLSNKEIMVHGLVQTKLEYYDGSMKTASAYSAILQASFDGKTFFNVYPLSGLKNTTVTANSEHFMTFSTGGILAPYYRVIWKAYDEWHTPLIRPSMLGAIKTTIIVPR